jgi:hypothetical protein
MIEQKIQREEAILLSLSKLDYLSRKQIQKLHNLGGDRNTRRILASIQDCVSSFRGDNGESIFHLNRHGRERIGCTVVRQSKSQSKHYLMRNDAYIHYPNEDWKNEMKFTVDKEVSLIADAYFRHNLRRHFLEVDHLQHMSKNREKIERYKKLYQTGVFQAKMKYFPRLVWVTLTESRRKQLLEWANGLDVVVHVWNEIK